MLLTGCKKLDKPCGCSTLGADACKKVRNSVCDEETEACTCLPFSSPSGKKKCEPDCPDFLFASDGSNVSPFEGASEGDIDFGSYMSSEPAPENMFGFEANGKVLRAGSVSWCFLFIIA